MHTTTITREVTRPTRQFKPGDLVREYAGTPHDDIVLTVEDGAPTSVWCPQAKRVVDGSIVQWFTHVDDINQPATTETSVDIEHHFAVGDRIQKSANSPHAHTVEAVGIDEAGVPFYRLRRLDYDGTTCYTVAAIDRSWLLAPDWTYNITIRQFGSKSRIGGPVGKAVRDVMLRFDKDADYRVDVITTAPSFKDCESSEMRNVNGEGIDGWRR